MYEAAKRIPANQAQQPKNQKNYKDSPKHMPFPLTIYPRYVRIGRILRRAIAIPTPRDIGGLIYSDMAAFEVPIQYAQRHIGR